MHKATMIRIPFVPALIIAILAALGAFTPTAGHASEYLSLGLQQELNSAFQRSGPGDKAKLSIHVMALDRGTTVVDLDSNRPMRPASLIKLVTMGAILELMGPDEVFETILETDGTIAEKILQGNLFIRGGGDPSLGPRFQGDKSKVTQLFDSWALELKNRGIRTINGNVIGDDTRYEDERLSPYWDRMEIAEWYSAEVSALSFNDNVLDIVWTGGSTGSRAKWKLVPETTFATISSSVRVGSKNQMAARIRYYRFLENNTDELRARGSIPPNSTKYDFAAIGDPARYTAHLLMESLERNGIKVLGTAMNWRTLAAIESQPGPTSPENTTTKDEGVVATEFMTDEPTSETMVFVTHESPPLSELLPVILGDSQNLYAEVLLREFAYLRNQPTTFAGGAKAVTQWLTNRKLYRSGFLMVDGSGLAPINQAPARLISEVLRRMRTGQYGMLWRDSLATPNARSLSGRMQAQRFDVLKGKLYAKTGYTNSAHTLAGYLVNHKGTEYIFTIMINGFDNSMSIETRNLIDDMVLMIHDYSELR